MPLVTRMSLNVVKNNKLRDNPSAMIARQQRAMDEESDDDEFLKKLEEECNEKERSENVDLEKMTRRQKMKQGQ